MKYQHYNHRYDGDLEVKVYRIDDAAVINESLSSAPPFVEYYQYPVLPNVTYVVNITAWKALNESFAVISIVEFIYSFRTTLYTSIIILLWPMRQT